MESFPRPVMTNSTGISYSYNYMGIATGLPDCPKSIFRLQLGLGDLPKDSKKEPGVRAPSADVCGCGCSID